MSDRPSDGMGLEELREEFDWISEFQSRMAERIRGDEDVHNLVDYVEKLERENTRLRSCLSDDAANARQIMGENDKLRELVVRMARALSIDGDWCVRECYAEFRCTGSCAIADALVELGIAEVVE